MFLTSGESDNVIAKPLVWNYGDAIGYCDIINSGSTIEQASIYLNPDAPFTVGAAYGQYDIQSVITHEAGHALGIAHCHEIGQTCFSSTCKLNAMNPQAQLNSIQRRTLQQYDSASYIYMYLYS